MGFENNLGNYDGVKDSFENKEFPLKGKDYDFSKVDENIKKTKAYISSLESEDKDDLELQNMERFASGEITEEEFDKLNKIEKTKNILYGSLDIKENNESNTDLGKFKKGLIDGAILNNIEIIDSLLEKDLDEFIDLIKNLDIKEFTIAFLEDIKETITNIFSILQDPYIGGLGIGELGLAAVAKSLKGVKIAERLSEKELNKPLFEEQNYKFLEKHKDIIGEDLKIKDIMGEGQNAIVLDYKKNPDFVVKIAKDKADIDDINQEYINHKKFYDSYREGIYKGELPGDIIIPKIGSLGKEDLFLIEKVNGETLYSQSARKVLEKKGIKLDKGLKDKEIDNIVQSKYKSLQEDINTQAYSDFAKELGLDYYDDVLGLKYYINKGHDNNIVNTLRYIKEKTGYMHDDLHSGNIMKSDKGKFIIDFGRIKDFNK